MDFFQINKMIGALLGAVLLMFGIGAYVDLLYGTSEPEHPALEAAAPEQAAAEAPKDAAPAEAVPFATLLAGADTAAGEKVFKKCTACHDASQGGPNKVGPNLWGIVGRARATHEGFAYSDAMKANNDPWSFDHLDTYLTKPKDYVPGTTMAFAGIASAADRANLIAWLNTRSDAPLPLPAAEQTGMSGMEGMSGMSGMGGMTADAPAAPEGMSGMSGMAGMDGMSGMGGMTADAPAALEGMSGMSGMAGMDGMSGMSGMAAAEAPAAPAGDGALAMLATADAAAGQKVAKKCLACHTMEEGAPNRVGPNLWSVVGRPVAGVETFKYSDAMRGHGGEWSFAALDTYLTDPKGAVPGNKMAFAGVKDAKERADLMAYLRTLSASP
ncbi:MAG TPA: cytochrome c family protein, partial [Hyphomicrobiales bacterium]|nr:cytochrome c family protein [Hyphomicrobiales bacterium]